MLELLYFRWWDQHGTPWVVLRQVVVVNCHRRLRHPASQRSLLHRPSYFGKLPKGSSSEADAMTTSPSPQRTRISLGHNLLCSTGRRDSWINTIESKFDLLTVPCSEANKARFAAAASWLGTLMVGPLQGNASS